ncbi:MAG TPA: hypothetical protein ENI98_12910 [Gammaproteobacteria bacterium]|nr:hypothetical protein [Gammaproteobacteria bacterium]
MINNVTYRHFEKAEKAKVRRVIEILVDGELKPLLQLPRRTLVVDEEDNEVERLLHEVFSELEGQVKKYKNLLRHESLWRRPAHRRQLREKIKSGAGVETSPALFRDLLRSHLKGRYNFVRREITYLTVSGELLPAQVTTDDVVDEVVVRAYAQQSERPTNLPAELEEEILARFT